jgi:hypothetical protein
MLPGPPPPAPILIAPAGHRLNPHRPGRASSASPLLFGRRPMPNRMMKKKDSKSEFFRNLGFDLFIN